MITQRILAVLAAILLIATVAVATLSPPSVTLGQGLAMLDRDMVRAVHDGIVRHLAGWMWDDIVVPLLERPAWLIPASLALICGGMAFSLSTRANSRRHRRS